MSMTVGNAGGYSSDINVTPMIDILLVMLIIFMVVAPGMPRGLDAMVPQPSNDSEQAKPPDTTIVVHILHRLGADPVYKINETAVAKDDLLPKLTEIYANRAERIMFVKGDDDVDYHYVAEVIDIGYAANVDHIGLMTPKVMAGQ